MFNKLKLSIFLFTLLILNLTSAKDVWLNVFIHGILKTPFSIYDLARICHNKVEGTHHSYMVDYLRNKNEVCRFQPMQEKGLVEVDLNKCNSSTALAKLYDFQYKKLLEKYDTQNYYYTFGWCGYLSRFHRKKEARILFDELYEEISYFRQNGINPRIRLIGFSHGGNIILNMAKYIAWHEEHLPFEVDEAILLAMPVHKESDKYANHPVFKKIYNFYSLSDTAQKADFFSTKFNFSHRKFGRKGLDLPSNLKQIQLKVTNIIFNIKGRIEKKYNIDPHHMEFWNFSWAPRRYRDRFPLKPFSVISLIPTIIHSIESYDDNLKDITFDIVPKLNLAVITNNEIKNRVVKKTLEFIDPINYNIMKNLAYKYQCYTDILDYRQMVREATFWADNKKKK